ncbi:WYL domain-containing protein [Kocuria flava]|uniref:WYL domain-containing protein n=1 Tax=Kocuria flava TaxID=446860 RepID=UPI001FF64FA8|nr:WYL domain-containing protein [Kocuria flava]MCJ8503696.1 WYL domain-containing protein [Kocuria flava]
MAARSTERLLNLLIALVSRERGYTRAELREAVPSYAESASEEAFERMFERDKAELRDLGYPIEEVADDPLFPDDTHGHRYRIPRGSFTLPPLRFTAEESAVLALAANAWTDASLGELARRALRKLEPAIDGLPDDDAPPLLQPTLTAHEPSFEPLLSAVVRHREVRFDYLARSTDTLTTRRVRPWGIGSRYGNWYVVGWDLDRQDSRTFRLSRIVSDVTVTRRQFDPPADFSMNEALSAMVSHAPARTVAVLARPGHALMLRRMASACEAGAGPGGADVLHIPFAETEILAEEIAAAGPGVVVPAEGDGTAPTLQAEVRAAVVRRLRAAAAAHARFRGVEVDWTVRSRKATRNKLSTADHLSRLLEIVRWVYAHQGAELEETARRFGITDQELIADLNTLFVCGKPGHMPDQLIDASWDDGHVYLSNADELSDPVRLTQPEASALLVGLQTLRTVPGGDSEAVASAIAKVAGAAGDATGLANAVGARPTTDAPAAALADVMATVRRAVEQGRRLRIRYVVPSRDELTERVVDPVQVFSSNTHWYVRAWCLEAEGMRSFRLDRISSVEDAGPAGERPAAAREAAGALPPAPGTPDTVEVVLITDRRSRWIADQYHAVRTAVVRPPDAPRTGPAGEHEAALVGFQTAEAVCSLVTRYGGQLAVAGPEAVAEQVELWVNSALTGYDGAGTG